MTLLSLTFHCEADALSQWKMYLKNELSEMIGNLMDAEQFILSDIESDMIQEGKNYNLLLFFDNAIIRQQFIKSELVNLEERITAKFGTKVLLFCTSLNPMKVKI
ncbi:MAG: DUF4286 family protein [Bacteroidetes bacterium]|nr:DUF4286 family protein [Bacteroidota bacterium]